MKGCLGCLGALVILALLAWPIEVLAQLLGWSDAQTGYALLLVLGLLAIGASRRRRGGSVAATQPGSAAERYAVPTAFASGGRPVGHAGYPPGWRAARESRPRGGAPVAWADTRSGQRGGRARDPLPAQLRFSVLQRDGFRCRYCGRPGSAPAVVLHVDHVVPLAAGGATSEDNLRTACEECNLGKAARAPMSAGS